MKPLFQWLLTRLRRSLPSRLWVAVTVAALTLAAAGLLLASYALPYWQMELHSAFSPDELYLTVYLHGVKGDVWEIDIWNRTIGMKPIESAGQLERQLSLYGLIFIAVLLVVSLFAGRLAPWLKVPGIIFPPFFVGMLVYFLYDYGHDLNPRAPIRIEPFMPALLGEYRISQFTTYSTFEPGFFMALGAAGLLVMALGVQALSNLHRRTQVTFAAPSAQDRNSFKRKFKFKRKKSEDEA